MSTNGSRLQMLIDADMILFVDVRTANPEILTQLMVVENLLFKGKNVGKNPTLRSIPLM